VPEANASPVRHIGHLTPSSNTVLEPLTARINAPLVDRLTHHFTRIRVTRIDLDRDALAQFDTGPMVDAASLLADAPLAGILWNGTSGGWRGLDADRALQRAVESATGMPFSTSILAQLDVFDAWGIESYGLAVPYVEPVADRIVDTFGREGYHAAGRATLGISTNCEFAEVPAETIRDLVRAADHPDAQCIVVICTNLAGALVAEELEAELGKPVFDSVVVTYWKALQFAGLEGVAVPGWGQVLRGRT
jgi:maleate isomerase